MQQRPAHLGPGCKQRRQPAGLLGPYRIPDIVAVKKYFWWRTSLGQKLNFHPIHQSGERFRIININSVFDRHKSERPVQRPAVQEMPAEPRGQELAHRALAGTARSVNGEDGNGPVIGDW